MELSKDEVVVVDMLTVRYRALDAAFEKVGLKVSAKERAAVAALEARIAAYAEELARQEKAPKEPLQLERAGA